MWPTSSRPSRAATTAAIRPTRRRASPASRPSTPRRSRSRCATPSPTFPRRWATRSLRSLPVDYIDQVGAKAYARKPVGTGPYVVESWRHGKEITWSRTRPTGTRPAGVGGCGGPAHLRRRQDHVDRVPGGRARLLAGAAGPGAGDRCPAARSRTARWTAGSWPAAALYFVGMNMTDPTLGARPRAAQGRQRVGRRADGGRRGQPGRRPGGRGLRAARHPGLQGAPRTRIPTTSRPPPRRSPPSAPCRRSTTGTTRARTIG